MLEPTEAFWDRLLPAEPAREESPRLRRLGRPAVEALRHGLEDALGDAVRLDSLRLGVVVEDEPVAQRGGEDPVDVVRPRVGAAPQERMGLRSQDQGLLFL